MMGMFGKSKARKYEPQESRTTFADVAGIDDAKAGAHRGRRLPAHPERYRKLGARIPRGVLLSGQPGTGKTLLARAVAGEADVPFFWMSASEFVEMFVGVGASRVRDLFKQAKERRPVRSSSSTSSTPSAARRSAGGTMGGNDEREQTLNQILTEMDGFTGDEGVIVMAATNRPEVLDPALLRPGRFDRRVTVNPPDQKGRAQSLRVHARTVPLAADVEPGPPGAHVWAKTRIPRLGLPIIAAQLAAQGHEVCIYSPQLAPIDWDDVSCSELVGLSTTTSTALAAYEMADRYAHKGFRWSPATRPAWWAPTSPTS